MKKILIANRGEIALRVLHAAHESGYGTVAVYSDPDAGSLPVRLAHEAYPLGGTEAVETYLDAEKILNIAKKTQVWAVHPGYGFLSENADFAAACERAGIRFLGPRPEAMRQLGSKIASKKLAKKAKVPVVPGFEVDLPKGEELHKLAKKIGFPLLIKAAAGGGGKGMRMVAEAKDLNDAVAGAQREAQAFFKDSTVFLEKYLSNPRHIEVQILGDEKGNLVHLYERECSIQRRHQKMIEEAPSPSIDAKFRKEICEAAVALAKEAEYSSAGTVEFIVDESGRFYFLEVNTRLQVEHPITEWTTGVDLVKAQILVGEGRALPFQQKDIVPRGHAIECRLYAEDPENDFLPAEGVVGVLREPRRPGVRVDSALEEGRAISSWYDPMLAKLTVHGPSRREALEKMDALLRDYVLLGVRHNLDFLRWILNYGPFQEGRYHTHTVAELLPLFRQSRNPETPAPPLAQAVVALAAGLTPSRAATSAGPDPARALQGFKNV
jgi:acetyl/propionyl-CoA carboxylase alpha subunit